MYSSMCRHMSTNHDRECQTTITFTNRKLHMS